MPQRSGFRVGRQEPESTYTLDPSLLVATMAGAAPLDRSGAFQALAMRQQFLRLARARLHTGPRGGAAAGPLRIQT